MQKKSSTNKILQIDLERLKHIPSKKEEEKLLNTLEKRFFNNPGRHKRIQWNDVKMRLLENKGKIQSLYAMEITGGEPDVICSNQKTDEIIFVDCSTESPIGRRHICYDREGQEERERKKVFPAGNSIDMAKIMGIELLTEEEYRKLQAMENFDLKSSSWIKTPDSIRQLGGALFAHKRYNHVFIFHNSASSFYKDRGFRGSLRV